jgi:hypothetical protein
LNLKINVIDFDKTLLPFDSFKKFVIKEISSFNIFVIIFSIFRLLHVIKSTTFKEIITRYIAKKKDDKYFKKFAESLYPKLNNDIIKLVKENSDEATINILLSASPDLYVRHIIKQLNWTGTGSYINNKNNFVSVYGDEKVKWLLENYSKNKYYYNYAISDNEIDMNLLKQFEKYDIWISH